MEDRLSDEAQGCRRTLLVGPAMTGGGAEGRFRTLATLLFGGSAEVAVLVSSEAVSREFGTRLLDLEWTGASSYPRIAFTLARRLRERRYAAVMAFGMFPGLVVGLARLFVPRGPHYVYSEITRPLEALRVMHGWRRHAYKWLWKFTARRFDLLTANSLDGLDEIRQMAGRAKPPGIRLHNLIDQRRIKRMAAAALDSEVPAKYLLWHGRLAAIKRVDTIIRAFAGCCHDFASVKLVILGEGNTKSEMQAVSSALGVADRVVFLARSENPFPILARASGFVLASELEGFSNAVIEAMFLDVPVITSYCSSDAREMCAAGAALGFDVGDDSGLQRRMRSLLADETVGERMRDAARRYCRSHEIATSLREYESLLRPAISPTSTSVLR